jgi:outer membrane protein OmpA-like peptidoglycan-associated protein
VRRAVLAVLLLTLGAARASAGGIEPDTRLLLTGGLAILPSELGTEEERPVFGLGISHRTQPRLLLELRAAYITRFKELAAASARSVGHAEGNLTWSPREDHGLAPFLSAGLGAARITPAEGENVTRFAWNGGAGAEVRLARKLGLRLEGRALGYKVPVAGGSDRSTLTWEALAGIVIGLGGRPEDFDADGVTDALDACPGTPAGVRVDAKGCPTDADGDGVWDGPDTCPDTPKGCTVDAKGCPSDTDGDGVWDGLDMCTGTPAGVKVDPGGCPMDADGDGVGDGPDACADTPKGCSVDAKGCPSDSDGDGVCDGLDRCAGTVRGAKVDAGGCEAAVLERENELLTTGMIRIENINFDTGTATLRPESFKALNEVGDILARSPGLRIEIGGHTDDRGTDMQNLKLSKARAEAVLEYLARKFPELDTRAFTVVGYGESQPLVPNDSEIGRAQNRRVEFKVLNPEELRRPRERKSGAPRG